jgi:structural maintenance of chromosome 3 (chondroitin sulfate proteoglycan 6)
VEAKALVALALIFAIQRCDPAPLLLMSWIKPSTYRQAVANLIHRQATVQTIQQTPVH